MSCLLIEINWNGTLSPPAEIMFLDNLISGQPDAAYRPSISSGRREAELLHAEAANAQVRISTLIGLTALSTGTAMYG